MLKKHNLIIVFLFGALVTLASCSKNYYSGTGKGSSCGCPSHKGMSGY